MKITQIKMCNFGPFYGDHEIDFRNDGAGVHIIHGNTGQGKTSLLRAILWSLYGRVLDRKGKEIPTTSLLNRTAFHEHNYAFFVNIYFNHDGVNWILSRKTEAKYHQDNRYLKGMKFYVVKDGVPQSNPELVIERILPYNISRFFFFDGEMLRDYEELLDQNSRSMKILRNSIEHILGIPYLRIARDDLNSVTKKIERERNRLVSRLGGQDFKNVLEQFNKISDEIELKENTILKLDGQIDELEEEISEKKRRLEDIKEVRDNAIRRNRIETKIAKLELQVNTEKEKLKKLNSHLYKTLLSPIALNVIEQLNIKHEAVMAKYDKKQQLTGHFNLLTEAKKEQQCKYCGTILNPDKLKKIEEEISEIRIRIKELTEIPEPNLEYENYKKYLEKIDAQVINRDNYISIESQIQSINHKIASSNANLKKVEEKLLDVDSAEPFHLEVKVQEETKELGRLEGEKSAIKRQLLKDYGEKSELNQKLSSINQDELKLISKKITLSKKISDVFENAISTFRNERRLEVEKKATEIFIQIRSKEDFENLEINENFGLGIITKYGRILNKAEWRSAGEEQIVALALIGALNKCAQIVAPVFMDTPFSRLDLSHGQRVLTYLPKMSEQIVIFVTDREFQQQDRKYLKGKIMSEHTLIFKSEDEGTFISKTSEKEAST